MSAIAGAVRLNVTARTDGFHLVRRMLALMAHRCAATAALFPAADDMAVLGEGRSGTGMAAPVTPDVLAVLDGEIYNVRPLRHALAFAGEAPASERFAEVAARGCRLYGVDFLHQLHGRFALALWNGDKTELLLARDRLGEKPLYYLVQDGLLLFASEIKALAAVLPLRRRLDRLALQQYLALGFVPPPRTMFQGIAKLGAGEMLTARPGEGMHRQSWWRPATDERKLARIRSLSLEQHQRNLRTLLESAVADRLTSKGPQAVILDAGAESRTIAALAARLLGHPLESVRVIPAGSAPPPEPDCRDLPLDARDIAALLPDLVRQLDEPIGDPRAAETWLASRYLTQSGARAALTADGAAELLPTGGDDGQNGMVALLRRLRRRLARSGRPPPPLLPPSAADFFAPGDIRRLLAIAAEAPEPLDFGPGVAAPAWMPPEGAEAAAYAELRLAVPERLLMRLDKAANSHGLELGLPFLDHQLVDYVTALPAGQRGVCSFPLLGRATETAPSAASPAAGDCAAAWFDGELGEAYAAAVSSGRLAEVGLSAHRFGLQLLDHHRRGHGRHQRRLWALMVLAEWCGLFWVDGGTSARRHVTGSATAVDASRGA